jgi:Plasmid stabilization system protein
MGCAVIFSAQAGRDLETIVGFIARHSPAAAERFGNGLIDRALLLGKLPALGAPVPGRPSIRRLVHQPWVVIYYRHDAESGMVEIVRFWDARQEPDTLQI